MSDWRIFDMLFRIFPILPDSYKYLHLSQENREKSNFQN